MNKTKLYLTFAVIFGSIALCLWLIIVYNNITSGDIIIHHGYPITFNILQGIATLRMYTT